MSHPKPHYLYICLHFFRNSARSIKILSKMYIYLHYVIKRRSTTFILIQIIDLRPGDKENVNIFTFGSPVSVIVLQEPKSVNIYTETVVR